jgi:hypothetical protein
VTTATVHRDATIPEDQRTDCPTSVLSCTAWGFSASRITPRAVSSYLAFSPLPALRCQRTGGVLSVTLSVTASLRTRRPRVFRGMLPYGVRTFLSRILRFASDHLPSARNLAHSGSQDTASCTANLAIAQSGFLFSCLTFESPDLFRVSNQWVRKNFFSPGRKRSDLPMIGRRVVVICRHTKMKIRFHNFI